MFLIILHVLNTGPVKSRPTMSAGRRSTETKEDSKAEASAVMKAMQEENQQAARFAKVSRPLPEPRKVILLRTAVLVCNRLMCRLKKIGV